MHYLLSFFYFRVYLLIKELIVILLKCLHFSCSDSKVYTVVFILFSLVTDLIVLFQFIFIVTTSSILYMNTFMVLSYIRLEFCPYKLKDLKRTVSLNKSAIDLYFMGSFSFLCWHSTIVVSCNFCSEFIFYVVLIDRLFRELCTLFALSSYSLILLALLLKVFHMSEQQVKTFFHVCLNCYTYQNDLDGY